MHYRKLCIYITSQPCITRQHWFIPELFFIPQQHWYVHVGSIYLQSKTQIPFQTLDIILEVEFEIVILEWVWKCLSYTSF